MSDALIESLRNFSKNSEETEISPEMEDILKTIAKRGETSIPWSLLKPLMVCSLEKVFCEFHERSPYTSDPDDSSDTFQSMRDRILEAFQRFESAPFTLQRLCELITEPCKHYRKCDKFLRGVEKNVFVVTTIELSGIGGVSDCDNDGFLLPKPPKIPKLSSRADIDWISTMIPSHTEASRKLIKSVNLTPLVSKSEVAKPCDPRDGNDRETESEAVIDSTSSVGNEIKIEVPDLIAHERLPLASIEGTDECAVSSTTDLDEETHSKNTHVDVKQHGVLDVLAREDEESVQCNNELGVDRGQERDCCKTGNAHRNNDDKHSNVAFKPFEQVDVSAMDTS